MPLKMIVGRIIHHALIPLLAAFLWCVLWNATPRSAVHVLLSTVHQSKGDFDPISRFPRRPNELLSPALVQWHSCDQVPLLVLRVQVLVLGGGGDDSQIVTYHDHGHHLLRSCRAGEVEFVSLH